VGTRVIQPSADRSLIKESGAPSDQLNIWLKLITDRALIIADGNPEGIYEANQGAIYLNESGTAGAILYIKRDADISGYKTQGWILV